MAEVETGDVLRMGATWQFEGAYEITNVWHALVQAGGGISYAEAGVDIQDYLEDIYTLVEPKLSDEMLTDYITLSNPTQATTFGAMAWGNALQGDVVTEVTAVGVCCLGWARTLKPRVQIRKYWGVFCEVDLQGGLWSSSLRAACQQALALHITPWSAGAALTLQGVAYNRTLDTFVLPISTTTAEEPCYQRRRRRGRGS